MGGLTDTLEFLSWPTEAVNALRGVLDDLNVPLPAVLAQLLALFVFIGLSILLLRRASNADTDLTKLVNRIVAVAAGIAGIAILISWLDHALTPRSEQIVGKIETPGVTNFHVDLVDYRGESLAPRVETDLTGVFVVSYSPVFADPPGAVVIRADECQERRIPLRRAQLIGAEMSITLICGSANE